MMITGDTYMRTIVITILLFAIAVPALAQEEPKPAEPEKAPSPAKEEPPEAAEITQEEIAAAVKALSARHVEERREARRKLITAGEPAVAPLIEVLSSESPALRATAAEILGFVGGEAAAPALVRLVRDKDLNVRGEARKALARIGPAAVKYLAEALKDAPEAERKEFDLAVKRMVTTIIKNLVVSSAEHGDEYGDYPGQFADVKKIGHHATPVLLEMARDTESRACYRFLAITALGRLGDKSAIPALKEIFEKNETYSDEAAISLAQLGDDSGAKKIIQKYRADLLNEPEENTQGRYMHAANLALFYHKQEKWKEAEDFYKRAIEIDPDCTGAYYNYACLLSVKNRLKEGMAAFKKALENGYGSGAWIMRDREIDNLRKLPEFKGLVEKYFGKAAGTD